MTQTRHPSRTNCHLHRVLLQIEHFDILTYLLFGCHHGNCGIFLKVFDKANPDSGILNAMITREGCSFLCQHISSVTTSYSGWEQVSNKDDTRVVTTPVILSSIMVGPSLGGIMSRPNTTVWKGICNPLCYQAC
ncbi:unnamed protein product, partial [Choristocarpus tenellus]